MKVAFPGCKVVVFIPKLVGGIATLVEGFDEEVIVSITKPLEAVRILRMHPTDVR
jgi:hypothetical protein